MEIKGDQSNSVGRPDLVKYSFSEGDAKVLDYKPEVLRDNVPVVIVPGWSENEQTYRKTAEVIYRSGRRVLSIGQSITNRESTEGGELVARNYPEVELKKAQILLKVFEDFGVEKADVVAHSEGAINILMAAILRPDLFRNIVLDKPAGLIGRDTKSALMGRFMRLLVQEAMLRPKLFTDPTSSIRAGTRTALYIAANPVRVIKEMNAITTFEITDLMKALHNHGITFSVISGVNDPLFPVKRQIEYMRENGTPSIEGYYSVVGGHNELSIHADKHAALAINALDSLQRVRSSR